MMFRLAIALTLAASAAVTSASSSATANVPLTCQPNKDQPMLPIYHIIGNVTQTAPGAPIKLEAINDCSGASVACCYCCSCCCSC